VLLTIFKSIFLIFIFLVFFYARYPDTVDHLGLNNYITVAQVNSKR